MGYRELLLTIAAISIFSITNVSVSRHMVYSTEVLYENQGSYLLYNYANSIIQQAKTREFDEQTINLYPLLASGFSIGKAPVESYPNQLDDVDDYDYYQGVHAITLSDTALGTVTLSVEVDFVADTDLNTAILTPTFYKRMTVTASSPRVSQPVKAVYVFAYQRN